jgi:hypothetical protein
VKLHALDGFMHKSNFSYMAKFINVSNFEYNMFNLAVSNLVLSNYVVTNMS